MVKKKLTKSAKTAADMDTEPESEKGPGKKNTAVKCGDEMSFEEC